MTHFFGTVTCLKFVEHFLLRAVMTELLPSFSYYVNLVYVYFARLLIQKKCLGGLKYIKKMRFKNHLYHSGVERESIIWHIPDTESLLQTEHLSFYKSSNTFWRIPKSFKNYLRVGLYS